VYSVPEHITMFGAAAITIGAAYPTIMAHDGGRGVPCPFRALTGIPCPFCGLTTATVALAHGQVTTAVATSPLVCLAAILIAGTVPVLAARATGLMSLPRPAADRTRRLITVITCIIVGLNWLFELHRYGFL
jgi:glycerol-3-phosphate acyltransferase PlsY